MINEQWIKKYRIKQSPPILRFSVIALLRRKATEILKQKNELRSFRPQANYTDQATAACRRS
jgi:hypothetical protein